MQIGFIGVGAMGGPLARNLIRGGQDVLVFDISPEAVERTVSVGPTGLKAGGLNDMINADIVFTSLPMPDDLSGAMLGKDGFIAKMKPGSFYIDVSTIGAGLATELKEACRAKGVRFIGCPLGRTPAHAEKAEEPMYVGGKEEDYREVQALLEGIGSPVIYMGTPEAAYTAKLLGNMMGGVFIATISEAFKVAEKVGLDLDLFLQFGKESGGDSAQMNVRGPKIVNNDFSSLFGLDLALKDMRLGVQMAQDMGVETKLMAQAKDMYVKASENGFGKEDAVAVFKVVESQ